MIAVYSRKYSKLAEHTQTTFLPFFSIELYFNVNIVYIFVKEGLSSIQKLEN